MARAKDDAYANTVRLGGKNWTRPINRVPESTALTASGKMSHTYSRPTAVTSAIDDFYPMLLALLLAGYALFSKAFAYIGVGPVYVGEIVFALGVVALARSNAAFAALTTLPGFLLALLSTWAVLRTLPYLGRYGFDALRDSVIVMYGGFAFIVTALLLDKPDRLALIVKFLRALTSAVIVVGTVLLLVRTNWSDVDIAQMFVKPGSLAVHLSGAALLMLLGFRRVGLGWLFLLIIGMALTSMMNRGAMLTILVPIAVAVVASGKWREVAVGMAVVVAVVGAAYTIGGSIPTNSSREISANQLVGNFTSIFGDSGSATDSGSLQGTKNWRLAWWEAILNYTVNGPYFWSGKGFGVNLALADGFFVTGENSNAPPLRSPHNSHFTILARTGVPGLVLWILTLGSWSVMLLINVVHARMQGNRAWADFFTLIFCYALAFIIEGTFDVALEGPMSGIWFWCLFGVGIGATLIYRAGATQEYGTV